MDRAALLEFLAHEYEYQRRRWPDIDQPLDEDYVRYLEALRRMVERMMARVEET